MPVHDEILAAARRICSERRTSTFSADDVVRALPHLNARTVRTHVVSRCCVNAPNNHPHKWDYFRRTGRGKYEILPKYRAAGQSADRVRERQPAYGRPEAPPLRSRLHGVVTVSGRWYTGECLELPIVTQGRTLDETVGNLRAAITLHLDGEDLAALGLAAAMTLQVTVEAPIDRVAAP